MEIELKVCAYLLNYFYDKLEMEGYKKSLYQL